MVSASLLILLALLACQKCVSIIDLFIESVLVVQIFFYFSVLLVSIFYCCYYFICWISVGLTVLWFPKVGASFLQSSCCCGFPSGPCFSLCCVVLFSLPLCSLSYCCSSVALDIFSGPRIIQICVTQLKVVGYFPTFPPVLISVLNPYGYRANLYGFNSFKFVEACVIYFGYCSIGIRKEYALCCIIEMPVESVG